MKWLVANKRKTGRLNYSKVITFRTPAGRGRKGERLPRNRRGKQTTSMVVSRNPLLSAPSIGANECENYPDVAQLHKLFYASCQPSVATHQAQLSQLYPAVYNPPGFPFHGGHFHHPYASTFQVYTPQARFQVAPPRRSLSIPPGPSVEVRAWHSGLLPHSYYLVALPKNMKKCYGCGDKISSATTQHRGQVLPPSGGRALVHSADFANIYYHPSPVQIMRKNPVFDCRVHIDPSAYHSLDEGQREMLKVFGLIMNSV